MSYYLIPAVMSHLIIIGAVLLMTISTQKFLKGQLKSILNWLLAAFWLMAVPYTLFIVREILYHQRDDLISWIIYLSMVAVGICILKTAILLHKFANVFGFADLKKDK